MAAETLDKSMAVVEREKHNVNKQAAEIIYALENLLTQGVEATTGQFAQVLKQHRFKLPEGFQERSIFAVKQDIRRLIEALIELNPKEESQGSGAESGDLVETSNETAQFLSEVVTQEALDENIARLRKDGYLEGAIKVPSLQEVLDSFHLTAGQMEALKRLKRKLRLVLEPRTTIDWKSNENELIGFRVWITEMALNFAINDNEAYDNPELPVGERWEKFQDYLQRTGLISLESSAIMNELQLGESYPFDVSMWFIEERDKNNGCVYGFEFLDHQLSLCCAPDNVLDVNARFRPAVVGDTLPIRR